MADGFGLKIGIEGEKEFKKALREINQDFKVLGSEMKLVTSLFDKQDNSVQAVTARKKVLSREIDEQKEKINLLEKALKNSTDSFGETDSRTKAWAIQLNNAKAELNGMEQELDKNNEALEEAEKGFDGAGEGAGEFGKAVDAAGGELGGAGKEAGRFGGEIDEASKKTSIFGDVLKASLTADAIKAGLKGLVNMVKEIGSAVKDYIQEGAQEANAAAENHAKLAQVMRNTMDAADGEVKSIVELAKAQERLGVVSETTQLGGAQELATYLGKTETLKKLLPVMNDMVAQQYGINATQESAVNIATMLGKVMNGQVGALSRYGYSFDETQAKILKFGTEEERAAVLADVVSESVGGVNAALAQTDAGKMAVLNAVLDETKTTVGEMANQLKAQIMGQMLPSLSALSDAFLGVLSGEGSAAGMAAAFSGVFDAAVKVINSFLPRLLELGGQLITAIVRGIADNIGSVIQGAMGIIHMLSSTLLDLLPIILDAGAKLLLSLLDGILASLPVLVEAAVQMIVTLATGLADSLPELIPSIVQAIILIVQVLIQNMPKILDAALKIIQGLAQGLLNALPKLVDALPKIITAIINFIVNNLPKIIEMGISLTVQLAVGLIQAIPQLVKAIPQIISAIIDGLGKALSAVWEIGKNIVTGLWNGIQSMASWIKSKVSDFVGGIVSGIKGVLGIHSPSTVFAGIGGHMAEGLGVGFTRAMDGIRRDMFGAIPTDFDVDARFASSGGPCRVSGGTTIHQSISVVTPKALSERELSREFKNLSRKLALEL
ncbi:MAG: phage tail protein [Clostridiaceae bacterium]|nr:phage tail protein [Eubacteriales bacterium]